MARYSVNIIIGLAVYLSLHTETGATSSCYFVQGLQVTWNAPEIDVTSLTSCPLHGYVVLLKSARDGLQQVKKWNVDGHRRSLMLHDVKEATTYHVRVSTVRCRGASKSSRWVTVHTRRHQRRDALPVSDSASGKEPSVGVCMCCIDTVLA